MKKSKLKWRIIWCAYIVFIVPIATLPLVMIYAAAPFTYIVDKIGSFKWWLVKNYKP